MQRLGSLLAFLLVGLASSLVYSQVPGICVQGPNDPTHGQQAISTLYQLQQNRYVPLSNPLAEAAPHLPPNWQSSVGLPSVQRPTFEPSDSTLGLAHAVASLCFHANAFRLTPPRFAANRQIRSAKWVQIPNASRSVNRRRRKPRRHPPNAAVDPHWEVFAETQYPLGHPMRQVSSANLR